MHLQETGSHLSHTEIHVKLRLHQPVSLLLWVFILLAEKSMGHQHCQRILSRERLTEHVYDDVVHLQTAW